ncbi:hypothetical protein E4U30_000879 [Claviceps sp. LM220 group G6]|nr:hypothetical protein E4U30_000879 [Claviceps sp. LM220 group G6]
MSELELILKEIEEEKRLRHIAEEVTRVAKVERQAAEFRRQVAEERDRAAREEEERRYGPLTVKEYVEECHTLDGKMNVVTKFTQITERPVVDSGNRTRPRLIVPWKDFPQKQREALNKLPSGHKFPPDQHLTTRSGLRMVAHMLKPIDSEDSLAAHQALAVTRPVEILIKEARQDSELRTNLGSDGDVSFGRQMNRGETTTSRSQSTGYSGEKRIADEFCSIKRSPTGESEIVLAVQYNLPQKLPVSLLVAALDNTTELNLDTGIIDEDGEEFGPKQLVAAVITQLFSVLVSKGLRYGYVDTGEAMLFLHIGDDISRVEYHLSCPRSDVHGDDKKMHLSAVPQLFAFVVQAIQAHQPSKEWEIVASELPIWKLKRVEVREKIPRIAEQPREEAGSHSPGVKTVPCDRTSIHTQPASRSTHHPADEQEASSSGSKTGKELPQNGGDDKRPDSWQDVFDESYCTHECVRGLAFGGPMDEKCPNAKYHGSKHINRQEFLRLMGEQLQSKEAHDHCKPINASGHIGHLYKVRLSPHGYTLVAKAVGILDWSPLIHEEKMYNHLRDLQGRFIPVCPGFVKLNRFFRCKKTLANFGLFGRFLFLSYAGKPVLKALSKFDDSVVSQVLATLAQLHQCRVLHRDAAPRNVLYDDCTGRYMVVDLEMSEPIDEEVLEAMNGCRKKRKTKRELKPAGESFAAESKYLLSKLSSSARTCRRRFEHVDSSSRILVYMELTPLYDIH